MTTQKDKSKTPKNNFALGSKAKQAKTVDPLEYVEKCTDKLLKHVNQGKKPAPEALDKADKKEVKPSKSAAVEKIKAKIKANEVESDKDVAKTLDMVATALDAGLRAGVLESASIKPSKTAKLPAKPISEKTTERVERKMAASAALARMQKAVSRAVAQDVTAAEPPVPVRQVEPPSVMMQAPVIRRTAPPQVKEAPKARPGRVSLADALAVVETRQPPPPVRPNALDFSAYLKKK